MAKEVSTLEETRRGMVEEESRESIQSLRRTLEGYRQYQNEEKVCPIVAERNSKLKKGPRPRPPWAAVLCPPFRKCVSVRRMF